MGLLQGQGGWQTLGCELASRRDPEGILKGKELGQENKLQMDGGN